MKKKGTNDFATRGFKIIHKVKKRQHQKPFFGHIGDEISKNRGKKIH
jgi:hypothetical protein